MTTAVALPEPALDLETPKTEAPAPREAAPTSTGDASILLATVYGGSSAAGQGLAASVGGALYGNLSTNTINQIIVNTETNALAAFYGTTLSYWARPPQRPRYPN